MQAFNDSSSSSSLSASASPSFFAAPACALVATHCCVCGRPLVDAESVRTGIGPIYAKKYGVIQARGTEAHKRANALIYALSAEQKTSPWKRISALLGELAALEGFSAVAAKISSRLTPKVQITIETVGVLTRSYKVEAPFSKEAIPAWRGILGRGFFKETDKESGKERCYNVIPVNKVSRLQLWDLLQAHYAGCFAKGPDGNVFEITKGAGTV